MITGGVLEAMLGHVDRGRHSVALGREELDELGLAYFAIGTAYEAAVVEGLARDPLAA
jgi:hypothetical protein